jgi:hypothetical protein
LHAEKSPHALAICDTLLPAINTHRPAFLSARDSSRRKIHPARKLRALCGSPSNAGTHFALVQPIGKPQIFKPP